MPFASFRYLSAQFDDGRVAPKGWKCYLKKLHCMVHSRLVFSLTASPNSRRYIFTEYPTLFLSFKLGGTCIPPRSKSTNLLRCILDMKRWFCGCDCKVRYWAPLTLSSPSLMPLTSRWEYQPQRSMCYHVEQIDSKAQPVPLYDVWNTWLKQG